MKFRWGMLLWVMIVGLGGFTFQPLTAQAKKGLEIYWTDVEGGAATLIVTPAGESLLVDTGNPGERDAGRILAVTQLAGVKRIDHCLTTHWHGDHVGGIGRLAELIPVVKFYDHGMVDHPPRDANPQLMETYRKVSRGKSVALKPGDAIKLKRAPGSPPLRLRVLASNGVVLGERPDAPQTRKCKRSPAHPPRPDDTSDNFRSVAFLLSWGNFDFFDGGDLTWNVEHKLVCPTNLIGTIDVYQTTHHGLDNSNNPALVAAVQPTVAITNNGPRKGGAAAVFATLKSVTSIQDVFQLHRNVQTTEKDNAPPPFVANDDEGCKGEMVKLSVDADAKSYTVTVPSKGTRRTYRTK